VTKWKPSAKGTWDRNLFGIKRHYTEAYCMRENVYSRLVHLVQQTLDGAEV
jgi:hypothetical protein